MPTCRRDAIKRQRRAVELLSLTGEIRRVRSWRRVASVRRVRPVTRPKVAPRQRTISRARSTPTSGKVKWPRARSWRRGRTSDASDRWNTPRPTQRRGSDPITRPGRYSAEGGPRPFDRPNAPVSRRSQRGRGPVSRSKRLLRLFRSCSTPQYRPRRPWRTSDDRRNSTPRGHATTRTFPPLVENAGKKTMPRALCTTPPACRHSAARPPPKSENRTLVALQRGCGIDRAAGLGRTPTKKMPFKKIGAGAEIPEKTEIFAATKVDYPPPRDPPG